MLQDLAHLSGIPLHLFPCNLCNAHLVGHIQHYRMRYKVQIKNNRASPGILPIIAYEKDCFRTNVYVFPENCIIGYHEGV